MGCAAPLGVMLAAAAPLAYCVGAGTYCIVLPLCAVKVMTSPTIATTATVAVIQMDWLFSATK